MQIVTLYRCEKCGNEYLTEEIARACEAHVIETEFAVGDLVYCPDFPEREKTPVNITKMTLRPLVKHTTRSVNLVPEAVGHYWEVEVGGLVRHNTSWVHGVYTQRWLKKAG